MKKLFALLLLLFILITSIDVWMFFNVDFTCYSVRFFNVEPLTELIVIFALIIYLTIIYGLCKESFSLAITTTLIILNIMSISYFLFLFWLWISISTWVDVPICNRIIIIERDWTYEELWKYVNFLCDNNPSFKSNINLLERHWIVNQIILGSQTVVEIEDRCNEYNNHKLLIHNNKPPIPGMPAFYVYIYFPERFGVTPNIIEYV